MRQRVLIVDDEEPVGILCAEILEFHGFATINFPDPYEALDELKKQAFDLLLVDFRMPQMNGFQMMELARKIQPQLAVVMMTGVGTMETAMEALRRGADGLTLKPFTSWELIENIRYALEARARKQDGQRLQAIRPLFDVTEQLFSKTELVHLETFLVQAVHDLIPCSGVGLFDISSLNQPEEISGISTPQGDSGNIGSHFGGVTFSDSLVNPQTLLNAARQIVQTQVTPDTVTLDPAAPLPSLDHSGASEELSFQPGLDESTANGKVGPYLGALLAPHRRLGQGAPTDSIVFDPTKARPAEDASDDENPKARVLVIMRKPGEPQFTQSEKETFLILCRQGAAALENANLNEKLQDTIDRLEESDRALRETIQRLEASQRALLHAEKLATAGRLTASIAHEINNPLQAVQNCLHLARRIELPAASRDEYMELADKELNRLMNTVQRMLGFYRPGQLDRKPININVLLEHVLELTQNQLEKSQIQLVKNFAVNLPNVLVVPDQIQQVFLNLIINACQAMDTGQGMLEITTFAQLVTDLPVREYSSQCASQVNILFQDTGPGILPEKMEHLFEPFYSTKQNGIGLGLPISYGIISAHGGEITVSSSPAGACFRVSLYSEECIPEKSR